MADAVPILQIEEALPFDCDRWGRGKSKTNISGTDARPFAGGSPAAGYLFLRGQENVTEKKAAQFAVPYGDKPALLDR